MATSKNGTQDTRVLPAAYTRPVTTVTKAVARATVPAPGASFRSTLLRSQKRYQSGSQGRSGLRPLELGGPSFFAPASLGWVGGDAGWRQAPQMVPGRTVSGRSATAVVPRTGREAQLRDGATGSANAVRPGAGASAARGTGDPLNASAGTGAVGGTVRTAVHTPGGRGMALAEFPRPVEDNGRGMHWVPTLASSNAVVDRFVKEAADIKVKWMVILNDGTKTGQNDYLVKQLVANGIMPIMRVFTPNGEPIQGDLGAMVRYYKQLGVSYFQLYNEPNLNNENPSGKPDVDRYLDKWIPAAQVVTANGGLPGLGALSPGGSFDDIEFLKQMLDKIKQRGEVGTLDKAWLSMHNYTFNHPLDYTKDSNGFTKFKWYDAIIREKLGRQMPIIGTEGGTYIGSADDKMFPRVDEGRQVEMVTGAYRYMKNREPYNFAYSYWVIANEEGGGTDSAFSHQALFRRNGPSPLVDALKKLD